MAVCTTSTNAATSWSVVRSRSRTAATNAPSTSGALARHAAASSAGTIPSSAWASVASSSTSSHRPKRVVSAQTTAISGVVYRSIMTASRLPEHVVVALGTHADDTDRDADLALDQRDEVSGRRRQVAGFPDLAERRAPAGQRRVDGLDVGEDLGPVGVRRERAVA